MNKTHTKLRLDKWLWAARFYKTRKLAQEMIDGGKVSINGKRCKSSHSVNIGDEIIVQAGFDKRTIIVKNLSDKRGSATQAATLFDETEASIEKRQQHTENRKLTPIARTETKPTKKQRRDFAKFKNDQQGNNKSIT